MKMYIEITLHSDPQNSGLNLNAKLSGSSPSNLATSSSPSSLIGHAHLQFPYLATWRQQNKLLVRMFNLA